MLAAPAGVRPPLCVHLVPRTDDAGAENQVRFVVEGLRDSGVMNCEVAYFEPGDDHESFESLGVPLRQIARRRRTLLDAPRRVRRLRSLYARRPPDVLHTWLLEGNILGLLAARAWPHTRVVITQVGGRNDWDWPWHMRAQRALLKGVAHAISNSTAGRDVLVDLGLEPRQVTVVGNAIPAGRIVVSELSKSIRSRLGVEKGPLLIWMGRLSDPLTFAQKDVRTFLVAVEEVRRRHPGTVALLVRPTSADLARHRIALPDHVRAIGFQSQPADILNAADVVVSSSRVEGNSVVVGEALMLGKPVASTDSGDHAKVVREAGGRVTYPGDGAALGRAILDLLDRPPDSARVRAVAEAHLGVGAVVDAVLGVYRQLGVVRDGLSVSAGHPTDRRR